MICGNTTRLSLRSPLLITLLVFLTGISFVWAQRAQVDTSTSARARRFLERFRAQRSQVDTSASARIGRFRERLPVQQPHVGARVFLEADRNAVQIAEVVRFVLSPTSAVVNSPFRFSFNYGDEIQEVKPRNQFEVFHQYRAVGSYTVSVSVQVPEALEIFEPTPVVDNTVTIQVDSVSLNVDRDEVEAGSPVTFETNFRHSNPNIQFRFIFGDGESSSWQDLQTAPHAYSAPGTYWAYAEIGFRQDPFTRSRTRQISVTPEQIPSPDAGLLNVDKIPSEPNDRPMTRDSAEQTQKSGWWLYLIATLGGVIVVI
ncbi:MAG: hypothetical protein AABZ61_07025, partial [Bacteroidota bacterium]